VKYGGSMLWGTMVFFLVGLAISNSPRLGIALISVFIAICVELFRLVHTPWLDEFRLTLPGALLLGRVFSIWNVLAYVVGIGFGRAARSAGNVGFPKSMAARASLPQLKPLESVQFLLNPAL
jgi:hypothetical protein